MRKVLKADDRIPFEQLFFEGSYQNRLRKENAGAFSQALEMARWAPSAGNKQPWRAIVSGDTVHFLEEKSMKESPLGDIQKVDLGIALCHFEIAAEESRLKGRFIQTDPGIPVEEDTEYIATFELER